ncbi:STAS domain-containing protein [Thalassotalea sp. SU-HH00458]|uniref:STAS domain-containing protein n=1 Tax=Thalassotalea sp. SU-HH00458 TaxID=3127657 RepID=UPI003102EAF9
MIEIKQQDNQLLICGALTRKTINPAFEKKASQLFTQSVDVLDLASVSHVDTAGLAWLLQVLAQAKKHHTNLHFTNLPQELLKIAKLTAVDTFLPIK